MLKYIYNKFRLHILSKQLVNSYRRVLHDLQAQIRSLERMRLICDNGTSDGQLEGVKESIEVAINQGNICEKRLDVLIETLRSMEFDGIEAQKNIFNDSYRQFTALSVDISDKVDSLSAQLQYS